MAERQGVLRSMWKEIEWEAGKSQSAPRRGAWGAGRFQLRSPSAPGFRPPRAFYAPGRTVSKKGQGVVLSPALQAWLDNYLVPRLVEEYLRGQAVHEEEPCSEAKPVPEFAANGNASSEVP